MEQLLGPTVLAVEELEKKMLAMPQVECPVVHFFAPGIAVREVSIPAGAFAIGHYQKFEHLNIMLKGRVTVINDDGTTTELVAPMRFVGKPGRKIGYVHEDVVWQNIYATTETDVEKLEEYFMTKSECWYAADRCKKLAATLQRSEDRADFARALAELGFTEDQVKFQSYVTDDRTDLPCGGYKFKVGESAIEGRGLIAMSDIAEGEEIGPARINGLRTTIGRYANHSATPNAHMIHRGGGLVVLVALHHIPGCRGGDDGDEITVDYRAVVRLNLQIGKE